MMTVYKPYTYKVSKNKTCILFEDDIILTYNFITKNIIESFVNALNGAYLMGHFHNDLDKIYVN